ncbi:hypothetical protein P168DRAFT_317996 [Aspergillus campestris IBT 28561]|uniref:Uncharacterized protein n=1 Tax=Aspergillus campestris (strain IBT 28561) TaxID=1392248 RepID=A0A2I1D512_ASPC2|nr:uncharacterized protein P168DRAFT_317996 [Aspergillus campestris IBT 28561]PKY04956.1 hypothetical protein P168DRAFT_317996 [Aspergillus campestris IBT 28561]
MSYVSKNLHIQFGYAKNWEVATIICSVPICRPSLNTQAEWYGNSLRTASQKATTKLQLLLDKGADVNAWDDNYDHTSQPHFKDGDEKTMHFLLGKGANLKIQTGYYGNVLPATSQNCHEEVVQLLLSKDANINTHSRDFYSKNLMAAKAA